MTDRRCAVFELKDIAESGKRTPIIQSCGGARRRLIQVHLPAEIRSLLARIRCFHNSIATDSPREGKAPALQIRIGQILRCGEDAWRSGGVRGFREGV